jgi:hypothetical protein
MAKEKLLNDQELCSAIELLNNLAPMGELELLQPSAPHTVYTTLVTVLMLTLQRLGGGKSLSDIVKDVLSHHRDMLPQNKRVSDNTLSFSSGAYSAARQRLALEVAERFATRVSQSLIAMSPPAFEGRRAFVIDGTTITLAPTPELQEAFPPATNQFGETIWPVAMLMVAHELQSGCALPPEIGAMYGGENTSEAEQAKTISKRIPRGDIIMADSNFGTFNVAYHLAQDDHPILLRMTKGRFKPLLREAVLMEELEGRRTHRVRWTPSVKVRKTSPELPADAELEVFLHEVPLENGETLYLVTTLPIASEMAAEYYSRRYDVEHDIRDVKVTLNTERILARTADMVKKELLTSIVAYNLVVQFRRQAAAIAKVPPRRLSFKEVWSTFCAFVLTKNPSDPETWAHRYDTALHLAAKYCKLPNRSKPRNYPRRAHQRRPKSTKFMKQTRGKPTETEPPEPK